jgi:hypothetical protein
MLGYFQGFFRIRNWKFDVRPEAFFPDEEYYQIL